MSIEKKYICDSCEIEGSLGSVPSGWVEIKSGIDGKLSIYRKKNSAGDYVEMSGFTTIHFCSKDCLIGMLYKDF